MVCAGTPGWPLCRERGPVGARCSGGPAGAAADQPAAPPRREAADAPRSPRVGQRLCCTLLSPRPAGTSTHTRIRVQGDIPRDVCVCLCGRSLLPFLPCRLLSGRTGALCPPRTPPHPPLLPAPPPRSPSASPPRHRRIDDEMKESRMQTWNQGRRPEPEPGSFCSAPAAAAATGVPGLGRASLHLLLRGGKTGAGAAQARRVREAPSPAAAGEPEKKGGGNKNSFGGTLVQAWERGCAGASLSTARGDRRRPSPERRQLPGARSRDGEKEGEREAASLPNTWIPPPVAIWELVISSDA